MREIIFRGKSKWNGEWVYGCLVKLGKESFSDLDRYGITDKGIPIMGSSIAYNFEIEEVIPETVGQYTGLVDKNNNKIFEGDILAIYCENTVVYFDDKYVGWYVRFADGAELNMWEYGDSNIKVIGNIHDNPELMEVK